MKVKPEHLQTSTLSSFTPLKTRKPPPRIVQQHQSFSLTKAHPQPIPFIHAQREILLQDRWEVVTNSIPLRLGRRASRGEITKVVQPGAAVEFRVDSLDLVLLGTLGANSLHDNDSSNLLLRLHGAWGAGPPAESERVAAVPHVENVEWNAGLVALSSLECCQAREGRATESIWTVGAAFVDELVDGVGVVHEVGAEVGDGGSVGV